MGLGGSWASGGGSRKFHHTADGAIPPPPHYTDQDTAPCLRGTGTGAIWSTARREQMRDDIFNRLYHVGARAPSRFIA